MNKLNLAATADDPVTIYYCKADIATGQTVRVLQGGQVHKTSGVIIESATASMYHDNAKGRPQRSGARCVLIITQGTVSFEIAEGKEEP